MIFGLKNKLCLKQVQLHTATKKKKSINIYNILCVCLKYLWKKTQETDKNGCLQEGKLDNKE